MVTQDVRSRISSEDPKIESFLRDYLPSVRRRIDKVPPGQHPTIFQIVSYPVTGNAGTFGVSIDAVASSDDLESIGRFWAKAARQCLTVDFRSTSSLDLAPSHPTGWSQISWATIVSHDATEQDIVTALRLCGLADIADRMIELQEIIADDPSEDPIELESFRRMAMFFLSERHLPPPHIGINPGGSMLAQWRIPGGGIIAIDYLSSGLIRYAAISGPPTVGNQRLRANGTMSKYDALVALKPFFSELMLE